MSSHEAENENYHLLQNGVKTQQPKDDGTDRRKAKKAAKKAQRKSLRGTLNADNLHFQNQEKEIWQYHYNRYYERILELKGEVKFEDEMHCILAATAAIRMYRKSRLESMFSRPFDRQMTQDPLMQTLNIQKAMGLSSNGKHKNEISDKDTIAKLLANQSESLPSVESISFDEWRQAELAKGAPIIERRSDTEFANIEDNFAITHQAEVESELG